MPFSVKLWGTRGSIPTPGPSTQKYGGNTACVEIRTDSTLFICDGGTGLRELGIDLLRRHPDGPIQGHMLFSHPHWDHIQGFPFFEPAYRPDNVFHIYGTFQDGRHIFELLSGQMRLEYFPVDFSELLARLVPADLPPEGATIDGVEVRAFSQHHPGGSLAFSLEKDGAKIVYATDVELDDLLLDREESLRDPTRPRRFPDAWLDFVAGADLLIADGQYTDQEYPSRRGWGHPRATTAVDLAAAAGVQKLLLTHHDPMQDDAAVDRKIAACQERAARLAPSLVVEGAREGMELRVGR